MKKKKEKEFEGHNITWEDIERVQRHFNIITPSNVHEYTKDEKGGESQDD